MNLKQRTIHRGILTVKQGDLTGEEIATIALNIRRGHMLKAVSVNESGEVEITLEFEEPATYFDEKAGDPGR